MNCLLLLFFACAIYTGFAQDQEEKQLYISTINGIETPVVTCVYKDSREFVWFGSLNGLYRWDGYQAKHYYNIPGDTSSLPVNQITGILCEDRQGNILFATMGLGIIRYHYQKDNFELIRLNKKNPDSIELAWIRWAVLTDENILWGVTELDRLFRFNMLTGDYQILYIDTVHRESLVNKTNTAIYDKEKNIFWTGTYNGLYQYIIESNEFVQITLDDTHNPLPAQLKVNSIVKDQDAVIWAGTDQGLFKLEKDKNVARKAGTIKTTHSAYVEELFNNPLDGGRSLWVIDEKGISRFDKTRETYTRYAVIRKGVQFASSRFIGGRNNGRYLDENGFLWLATDNLGAAVISLRESPFKQCKVGTTESERSHNGATSFFKDRFGNLYVGTGFNGLYLYNAELKLVKSYQHDPGRYKTISNNYIYSLLKSSDDILWVGTNNGLDRIDLRNDQFKHFVNEVFDFDGNMKTVRISELFQDSDGWLWAGTSQGAYCARDIQRKNISFQLVKEIPPRFTLINQIIQDTSGNLWFSIPTYQGIFELLKESDGSWRVNNYKKNSNDTSSFVTDGALSICEGKNGIFWLGTKEGLYKWNRKNNEFVHFGGSTSIGVNMIYWLEMDRNGVLWMITEKGLMKYDPKNNSTGKTKVFTHKDGLPFEKIYPYRFYQSPDGFIYIGGRRGSGDGFYYFHPDSIHANTHIPPVILTRFTVRNKPYELDSNLTVKKKIVLPYANNFFSFEFAVLDYTDPEKNEYAFFLEGLENEWNYAGNRHFVNYTDVHPGNYIFRVKGSNNDGYWNEAGASISVTVLPPPWKTWWAYLLYGLFLIALISTVTRFYLRRQRLLMELDMKQRQAEKLAELDKMKSEFFANISHEFRTPLTLILGPIEQLISKLYDKSDKEKLTTIQRNAVRLKNLISQLLNLSRLEAGKLKLKASKTDIVKMIGLYMQSFESLAKQNDINLKFQADRDKLFVYVDKNKMEQIMNNLLSNAFKFTDRGGEIIVYVTYPVISKEGKESVSIKITDNGRGIPYEHQEHIFDRFYQADDSGLYTHEGTGIGLAICKELVELHHGTIQVQSEPGKYTAFIILLPTGKEHLEVDELADSEEIPDETAETETLYETEWVDTSVLTRAGQNRENDKKEQVADLPVILIVEDNSEMRAYIRDYFKNNYHIVEASDGKEGLEEARDVIPDIIVSDVMMPNMDGIEFCRKVKSDERTSHIPVILLTAKASKESRIESLETGADDFITKPFDGTELQVRVNNLIRQRKKLRELISKRMQKSILSVPEDMEITGITSMDEQFLQKLFKMVSVHYSNAAFNVESCCRESGMSRTQLHRKIKALTGQTAGEFIRVYRLNRAAELLKKKSGTVAEIAYDVGFSSPSYFSECFRKQFGKLPSEIG